MCLNPTWGPVAEGETHTTSDEQQQCRKSYEQAIVACGETPSETKTSTISPIPTLD